MHKRLVTRYATQSSVAADENQRRIEGVFAELTTNKPDNVSYIVLRLADDSFVHLSFHDHGDNEVNPITSTAAFAWVTPASGGGNRRIESISDSRAAPAVRSSERASSS